MKLTVITPYYHPKEGGGMATYVIGLITALKRNYNILIDVITEAGESSDSVNVLNTYPLFFPFKAFLTLLKLKPDVIHSHSHIRMLVPGILYKLLLHPKTKVIHTLHTYPSTSKKSIIIKLKERIYEWLLSKCDAVTFVSKFQKREIEKNLKIKMKKRVVYAGVLSQEANEKSVIEIKNNFELKDDDLVLSFIGNLSLKVKAEGANILIKAMKIVITKYPKIKLLIIGDGEYKNYLERMVKDLNLEKNIIFLGFMDNVFVPLSLTNIYIHISFQEALGIALLEAMSKGIPVIASKTGGIPEVIDNGKNGILVDFSSESIAKAIVELYENKKKMAQLGENARNTIKKQFSWDKAADEYMKIYLIEKR